MTILIAILFGVFLAYANGANDNFKGVATLFGSGTTDYKRALLWGTVTTLLGSVVAFFLAQGLLATFSGKGLVPDSVVALRSFSVSVVLAAAATVMLATKLGFPISTTHALTGALVGAGWIASSSGVNLSKLGSNFFAPLIASPVAAILLASALYPALRFARKRLNVRKEKCLCVGTEVVATYPQGTSGTQALAHFQASPQALPKLPSLAVGSEATCQERYAGSVVGINARTALDTRQAQWRTIAGTRYARHFKIIGDTSTHYGLFDCGPKATSAASDIKASCC